MNGLRAIPLINGVEPAWASLIVNIAGFPEIGIRAISYKDEQEMENIYGAGQRPIARGYGRITATGSITLLRSAVEAIRTGSLTGRLQDLAPFNIVVQFLPINGGKIITHKIRNCQFKSDELSTSEGDMSNETEFELLVSHIDWN